MREGAAEVGAVNIGALLLRNIYFFATGTEDLRFISKKDSGYLDSRSSKLFWHTYGENSLSLAEDSGADSEFAQKELFSHDSKS